jgi:hypothetical protein
MKRFFLWFPGWLQTVIVVVTAGLLTVFSAIFTLVSKSPTGHPVPLVVLASITGAASVGMQQLRQWQVGQTSRTRVALKLSAREDGLRRWGPTTGCLTRMSLQPRPSYYPHFRPSHRPAVAAIRS